MTAKNAKKFLIDKELTVAEMARQIAANGNTNASEPSLRVMITNMINGRDYYPTLAEQIEQKFGLKLERPSYLTPLPTRQAA